MGQLSAEQRRALLSAAQEVREQAYAPYSGFLVGAAVLSDKGQIYTGCNVEISSFSHTCCAERVAVFSAVTAGHQALVACAVVTGISHPVSPCGACRQVLNEFSQSMIVLLGTLEGEVREVALEDLLPDAFDTDQVMASIRRRHGN